jgi:hypothetical protein
MLKQVKEQWWMLRFEGEEGRFVWFGYSEGHVKQKFESWMRQASSTRLRNPTRMTGALSETAYGVGT